MNAAEFYQIWCRSEDFWKIPTGDNVWLHFAEAFAASETAAKEAAEQRAAQDKEFYTRTKAEWKARAEAAEAERDRLKEMLRLAIEGANGQQERIEAERDQIANAYKQCSWERDMFEAERDRAVRALEFLKSYNRGIYDCAIRVADEPIPVPAPEHSANSYPPGRVWNLNMEGRPNTSTEAGPAPTKENKMDDSQIKQMVEQDRGAEARRILGRD